MKKSVLLAICTIVLLVVGIGLVGCRQKPIMSKIKIGILFPLTGPSANQGQDALNAVRMKLDELGGPEKTGIELVVEDEQSNPAQAMGAFQKMIDVDKVPLIIGPISSSIVLGLAPEANRRNVVMIAIGASNPKIADAGDFVFRHALLAEPQSEVLAKYTFNTLKQSKVAFLYINDETGLGYVGRFRDVFRQLGGEVVAEETFDRQSRDFRTQLAKLKESGASVVFSPGTPSSVASVLKQSAELAYPCTVLAGYGVEGQDIITIAGEEGRRLIYTSMPYDSSFVAEFQKRYGKTPSAGGGLAYDAMALVAEAVHAGNRNAIALHDFLLNTKGYVGATGRMEFDKNGDTQKTPVILKTVFSNTFIALSSDETQK